MIKNTLKASMLLAVIFFDLVAYSSEQGYLVITDSWARKSISPNNNSAAYMKISNPTNQDITIIGASSPKISDNAELHKSFVDENGISRMTSIDKIVVPAKTSINLSPGGIHVMLLDLKKSLNVGDNFEIQIKTQQNTKPFIVSTKVK